MPSILVFSGSGAIGYFLFNVLSHPNSRVKNRIPHVKLKWVQLTPNIRIYARGRVIIMHHWMNLSIILVISILVNQGFLDLLSTKGILLGGIVQGFTYPDWRKIVLKMEDMG
jgi:hypothetical protein